MGKMFVLVGFVAGAIVGATVGRKKVMELTRAARQAWERPEVQQTWRKANRYVAEKAPTLHGMGEAVADAMPKQRVS
jgi:membrane protein required for beta-lactamase induction